MNGFQELLVFAVTPGCHIVQPGDDLIYGFQGDERLTAAGGNDRLGRSGRFC